MAQHDNLPVPDPSALTTEQLERAVKAERDYVNGRFDILAERLNGMDEAARVLNDTITKVPTDVQQAVGHLKDVTNEKFISIGQQLETSEHQRLEQKADAKTGLDAALSAQKEAASEQNKSNTLAISKSETATTETINKLAELFKTTIDALAGRIDELKERLDKGQGVTSGTADANNERRLNTGTNTSIVMAILLGLSTIVAVGAVMIAIFKP